MKKFLAVILSLLLLTILILLTINFVGFTLYSNKSVSRSEISGSADSSFIAETVSTSKTIDFTFTPRSKEVKNYLLSYELKKDGTTMEQKQKRLIEGVSQTKPITIHTSRDNKSEYSLETIIYDTLDEMLELHNDKIVIHPQENKKLK